MTNLFSDAQQLAWTASICRSRGGSADSENSTGPARKPHTYSTEYRQIQRPKCKYEPNKKKHAHTRTHRLQLVALSSVVLAPQHMLKTIVDLCSQVITTSLSLSHNYNSRFLPPCCWPQPRLSLLLLSQLRFHLPASCGGLAKQALAAALASGARPLYIAQLACNCQSQASNLAISYAHLACSSSSTKLLVLYKLAR